MDYFVHKTAEVSPGAVIGKNTQIWHGAQVRERARIGKNCIIGKNVYIDFGVKIGNNCKIQNNCSLYRGAVIEDGVFIGPHVVLTNDKFPRAINKDGSLKADNDWQMGEIVVKYGASIGTHSVILPNVVIGRFALIGAGSVVTKDVPDFALTFGIPARIQGYVNEEGKIIKRTKARRNKINKKNSLI